MEIENFRKNKNAKSRFFIVLHSSGFEVYELSDTLPCPLAAPWSNHG